MNLTGRWDLSTEDRFLLQVAPCPITGCWFWTGTTREGYGRFRVNGKLVAAHRYAYEQAYGPIPCGLVVDHLCRVHSCVNPAHLRTLTSKENTHAAGSIAPAKLCAEKTVCDKCGSALTKIKRQRYCLPCHNKYNRDRRASLRAKAVIS